MEINKSRMVNIHFSLGQMLLLVLILIHLTEKLF